VAGAAVLLGCSGGADSDGDPELTTTSNPTPTPTPTTEATTDRTYEVGLETLTVIDPSRETPAVEAAALSAQPTRSIGLLVLFPAEGRDPADGPFPLVVFAHGWNGLGENFVEVGQRWAAAGYVVALPTFPLSRQGIAYSEDYVNQPADISFVIDELIAETGELAGLVDGELVAVGGHSLGSATVFRTAYNACCVDERVDATFPVSGGPLDLGQGGYESWRQTPMLLVHGAADPFVPVEIGDAVFEFAEVPSRYLRMASADHNSVFTDANGELFADAVLLFLDATLGDDPEAFDALADLVEGSGIAELRVRAG